MEVRYGNTAQMAAQLQEEGERTPADVFYAQDAGALGAVAKDGLFATLPADVLNLVPEAFRASSGEWVGVTGRSRVLVYHPDRVPESELPSSVFELTEPQWRGRVGVAPTNASFQAYVTAMRVTHGDDATKRLEGMVITTLSGEQHRDRGRWTPAGSTPAWSTTTVRAGGRGEH